MNGSGKNNPAIKKSYEIAYALCRLSAAIHELPFAESLMGYAIALLNGAIRRDKDEVQQTLLGIDYFLNLGLGLGYLSQRNTDLLSQEMNKLQASLESLSNDIGFNDIELADIFTQEAISELESVSNKSGQSQSPNNPQWRGFSEVTKSESGNMKSGNPAIAESEYLPKGSIEEVLENRKGQSGETNGSSISIENRQSAILERIRQSGNCRIRDLQEAFPDYSERTLRYDVESLIAKNVVERVGAGSATFYRPIDA